MFDHILNWKLLPGSHGFPGPDGGTCINEAAIVAAGFKYRAINSACDCPPCFSRPIAAYAIKLNDLMPHALRQELLLPFVLRLAGTADSPKIEARRARFMVMATINEILPVILHLAGLEEHARACGRVTNLKEAATAVGGAAYAAADADRFAVADAAYAAKDAARFAASAAAYVTGIADTAASAAAYVTGVTDAAADVADTVADAARFAASAAAYVTGVTDTAADTAHDNIYKIAVSILDRAIKMGKEGDTDSIVARERMEKVKRDAVNCG